MKKMDNGTIALYVAVLNIWFLALFTFLGMSVTKAAFVTGIITIVFAMTTRRGENNG